MPISESKSRKHTGSVERNDEGGGTASNDGPIGEGIIYVVVPNEADDRRGAQSQSAPAQCRRGPPHPPVHFVVAQNIPGHGICLEVHEKFCCDSSFMQTAQTVCMRVDIRQTQTCSAQVMQIFSISHSSSVSKFIHQSRIATNDRAAESKNVCNCTSGATRARFMADSNMP